MREPWPAPAEAAPHLGHSMLRGGQRCGPPDGRDRGADAGCAPPARVTLCDAELPQLLTPLARLVPSERPR
jgi:hypothetical protein